MRKITLIFMMLATAIFSWQSSAQLSYNNACTNAFDDISTTGIDLALSDDGEENITIPFGFTLDGFTSTDLRVGNNGGVLFDVTTGDVSTGSTTPTAPGFYPFNDDIDSDYGAVYWETLGTAPNRRVVILWNDRPHYSNSSSGATFELILHETTNEITFLYQDTDFGAGDSNNDAASAAILVVGANGSYMYSMNQALNGVTCINWVIPTCLVATDIVANGTGTTTGEVSWTDNNGLAATDYEYVVQAQGTGTPTAAGTQTTANPQSLTGLTASTPYEVYLRANCGSGDFSEWRKADFVTQCSPFNDFTEDFDSTTTGEVTLCWNSYINSTSTSTRVSVESTDPNSGANAMELYNDSDDASDLLLITPNLADMPNADHRIRFMAKGTGTDPAILVGTMTDPTDFNTFVPFQGIQLTNAYAEYSLAITSPPAGANYIAFQHGHGETFQTIRIDDFVWEPTPSCIEPSDIFVNAITASGASISWVENNSPSAANWDLYIVPTGDAAPDAASSPTLEETAQPVVWTGGTASTEYDVYVRTDCGNDNTDVSTWTGPVTFRTLCDTYTAPYTEDFEDAGAIDQCWTQESADNFDWSANTGATVSSGTGPSAANSGDYYIYTETSSPIISGDVAIIYSPNIDITALTTPRLNFAYHMYGAGMDPDGSIDVAISTDGGANYTSIFNQVGNQGDQWNSGIVALSAYTGVVSFRITGTVAPTTTGNTYENDFAIDDFKVEETPANAPDCAVVTGADTSAGCGDRGVTLSWDAVTGADGYRVTVGTTTGGNDIADNQDLGAGISFAFPSTPNTEYFYTVIAYNAIGDATGCAESSFTSFATGCPCDSTPTSNDGDGVTNVQLGANDYPSFGDVTYENHTGEVITDLEQVVPNNLQITFATGYTYGTNVWIDFNDDNVFDNATELVYSGESTNANPTTLDASFVINPVANQGVHFMRIGTADSGQATPDPCYNGSWGVTLDFKVNILPPPSCLPPTDLTAMNITASSADLSWTTGGSGESLYDIEIVDVTAGDTVTGTATYTDQANPYALSGLAESNDYQYYVRSNCGGGDYSAWAGPFDFSTTANCIIPSDLTVTNIDAAAGTADFGWTDTNPTAPANGWEYEIVDITAGGVATGTGVATATNPVSVTSLVAGNQYEFLVRAVCDATSSSDWSNAYAWTQMDIPGCVTNPSPVDGSIDVAVGTTTFTWDAPTDGGAVVSYDLYGGDSASTLVFVDNTTATTYDYFVDMYNTTYYWQVIAKNAGGESVGCSIFSFTSIAPPGCGDTFTDFNGAGANYSNSENYTWTLVPDNVGDVVTVTFTAYYTEGNYDFLKVYDGPDSTFPEIANLNGDLSLSLPVFTSSDASGALTFVFTSDSSVNYSGWEADITCGTPPVCADPTNLAASNITDLTADLSWDDNSTPPAMGWDIEWGPAGFAQGSGTMVTNTANNPYSLSGLTAETDYEFYVKANCATPYESGWAGPFAFTTAPTPTCIVPTALTAANITDVYADLGWTDGNTPVGTEWDIEWGMAGFTQGSGTMVSGTNDNPYALSGLSAVTNYEFYVRTVCSTTDSSGWAGPFAFTTMPTPPINNDCANATALTVGVDFATNPLIGTNVGATDSGELAPGCADYQGGDVWYSVEVPSDGILHIEMNSNGGITDGGMAVYSGTCGSFTLLDCDDSSSSDPDDMPLIDIDDTALAGQTLYVRAWEYGNNSFGEFTIAAYNSNIAATNDLATVGFNYYPNPVTNTLTMTANENITSVSIFNMLGQEVKNEKLSSLEAHIDMSNLANGTYFVKAQVGQTIGTFKIVKK